MKKIIPPKSEGEIFTWRRVVSEELNGQVKFNSYAESATTLGTVIGKLDVYDISGTKLGSLPVYDDIT